ERRVAWCRRGRTARSADAEQSHVIEDRVLAEQTDISADQDGTDVLVAECQIHLPNVQRGRSQRGFVGAGIRVVRVTAGVRDDTGIKAKVRPDVDAVLCRDEAERDGR